MNKVGDRMKDCPNGNDEPDRERFFTIDDSYDQIGPLLRFDNMSECTSHYGENCNEFNCFITSSYVCSSNGCNITDSLCSTPNCNKGTDVECNPIFQCSDGNLIAASQFCDGTKDCPDNSDEIHHQPGFKCAQSSEECVLPQLNLHDDVAHCDNARDLCNENHSCFECFDRRLWISSKQVCDRVIDCYDLSDECLCDININKPNCEVSFSTKNESLAGSCTLNMFVSNIISNLLLNQSISLKCSLLKKKLNFVDYFNDTKLYKRQFDCVTKNGVTIPALCNGQPECSDFSDECDNCENPPSFCSDPCFSFYTFGDRYCDGVIDEVWKFINDSSCPRGFDEIACPGRFYCKSGDKVSIPNARVCDGTIDCDDESDEQGCSETFSSDTEMIENPVLRYSFWIMGFVVTIGNLFVIVTTTKLLRTSSFKGLIRCQHVIVLNISCADFIMGIYLLMIAVFSQIFSGFYGSVDMEWRTSLRCSIIGSLAVISSEASCFLMVSLSALRLWVVCKPFASRTASTIQWKIAIFASWLIAIVFGIVPIPYRTLHYFVHTVYFPNQFSVKGFWSKSDISKFACHFAALKNLSIIGEGKYWESTRLFLNNNFQENTSVIEFGYYGKTSVCMPRFYVEFGDSTWEYTFTIITINLFAFIFIATSYISVYLRSKMQGKRVQNQKTAPFKKESKLQKRIARIIATDFICWIPICIMSYINISGIEIPFVAYQVSAVYLLPINSALNPYLFSSLLDTLLKKLGCCKKTNL